MQKAVAFSTMEVEYVAATETCEELKWLQDFIKELGKEQVTPSLHSDIQSAIDLTNNPIYHDRTKHIDVRYHFICILLKDSVLSLVKIHTNQNSTDMLTKVVTTLGEFGVSGRWQGRSDRAFQSGVYRAKDHSKVPSWKRTL